MNSSNIFVDAPTVGSDDIKPTTQEEQTQDKNREQQAVDGYCTEPQRKKRGHFRIRWGKVRKFFKSVILPVLTLIPPIISALARLTEARTRLIIARRKLREAIVSEA